MPFVRSKRVLPRTIAPDQRQGRDFHVPTRVEPALASGPLFIPMGTFRNAAAIIRGPAVFSPRTHLRAIPLVMTFIRASHGHRLIKQLATSVIRALQVDRVRISPLAVRASVTPRN